MPAFDKCNAAGFYDDEEPSFTEEELTAALEMRQSVVGRTPDRSDRCPHAFPCASVAECVEKIAWYRRHQHEIERRLATGFDMDRAGYVP